MLVLSRRRDEAVVIGDEVRIRILSIDRNQVRIGIEAPGDVSIVREELIRCQTEQQELAGDDHHVPLVLNHER